MLRLTDLHKAYGDVRALDGCTLEVGPGVLRGFLGPKGAGKTTAMRTILGLVTPDSGSVTWQGEPLTPATRLRFGYMPEQRGLYPRMRIGTQLVYFGRLHGMTAEAARSAAATWLERFGLADRAGARLEDLSHGNQQRVQLAIALLHDPELLILDEPFSGLDPIGIESMAAILGERAAAGTAVIFSSHQLDLVEDICESVDIISGGRIVLSGEVTALRNRADHRLVEVSHRRPAGAWFGDLDGIEVVSANGTDVTLRVAADHDPSEIVAAARRAGEVALFSFPPPPLSHVFREAVGR